MNTYFILEKYKELGDGTFLVRESDTFVGDYTLSFWYAPLPPLSGLEY
jgi:hypothetical protein